MSMRRFHPVKLILLALLCMLLAARPVQAGPPTPRRVITRSDGVSVLPLDAPATLLASQAVCSLPAPTLVHPEDAGTIQTLVPSYQWTGTGANMYYFQVSPYADFHSLLIDVLWIGLYGPTPSVDWPENLAPETTYYWRVGSVCSDGSVSVSPPSWFQTAAITGPFIDPPALLAPEEAAEFFVNQQIDFSWEDKPGAEEWKLRVYPTLEDAQTDGMGSTAWSMSWFTQTYTSFPQAKTYYWRLSVRDGVAWGPLSPYRSFVVKDLFMSYFPVVITP